MRPWNIAHRGGAGLKPENTLAAFADAVARGCDGAELDVQLSKDGQVVVFHDFRLKPEICRGANGKWLATPAPRLKDLTLAELREFDIGRCDPASDYARQHPQVRAVDGERIPTLAEVIAVAQPAPAPFYLLVELKCDMGADSADPVMLADAALAVVQGAEFQDRTIFVGFDWRALARVKEKSPAARCWFTTGTLQGDIRPVLNTIAAAAGQGWFPAYRDATQERVAQARALGLKVAAWTVDDPADMRALSGLDALCTDRPDLLDTVK